MIARWAIRAAIIAALAALVVWIAMNTYWDAVPIPQPLKGEAATNPFYSAAQLARSLGAQPRWQRILGSLPPRRAVVFASAWHWSLMPDRRERLQRWVAAGGRLVVDRSLIGGQPELEEWAGISRYVRSTAEIARADRETTWEKCPTLHATDPQAPSLPTRARFSVCNLDRISGLRADRRTSWKLRDASLAIQAVRVPVGLGSVTMINAMPFGNRALLDADHAALFVAATQLQRGDPIWFLTEEKGASLLSLIWTTASPVVLLGLALVVLWLWRSSVRFGPPVAPTDPARRSLAEQIRGTGEFTVRCGGGQALQAATLRALQETADRSICGYSRMDGEARVAKLAELSGTDVHELATAMKFTGPRRRGELRQTLALLESVRRAISNITS